MDFGRRVVTFYDPVIIIIFFFLFSHTGVVGLAPSRLESGEVEKANVRRAAGRGRNGSVTEQKPEAEE